MFEILPESQGRFLAVAARGKLTDTDYKAFVPLVEARIAAHGPIRMLVDMTAFAGWTAQAAWDDFLFGLAHRSDLERIALVGDKRWEAWAAKLADAFMEGEVRCFPSADRQAAWDYILDLE